MTPHLRRSRPALFVLASGAITAWVHLRVVVLRDSVRAYLNESARPALSVPRLGIARRGEVGVWVGNVGDGEFANLRMASSR